MLSIYIVIIFTIVEKNSNHDLDDSLFHVKNNLQIHTTARNKNQHLLRSQRNGELCLID